MALQFADDRADMPAPPSYAARALDQEATDVSATTKGGRSAALNRAAFNLGQLVVIGALPTEEVQSALLDAATVNGLVKANGRTDVLRTIMKGIAAGELRPRERKLSGFRADGQARAQAKARAEQLRRLEAERIQRARAFCDTVWLGSESGAGGPVEQYLRSRGLGASPGALRHHGAVPLGYDSQRTSPAMVAAVQDRTGRAIGLHVTPIQVDGSGRAPGLQRLMFGTVGGGFVRLADHTHELAVAEGIETAMSFQQLFQIPTWAVLSTSGLRGFAPPPGLRRLVIAADRDDTGDGMRAAYQLAETAKSLCEVAIAAAPDGQDWNDALRDRT